VAKQGDKVRARLARTFPKQQQQGPGEVVVADGRIWVKVAAPRPWRPLEVGSVLVGELAGRSTKPTDNGGVYGVVTIKTDAGAFTVFGVVITSLFEAAACPTGAAVRIVYLGERVSGAGRVYRDYDLFLSKI
jgi:hypothetical protein